MTLRSLILCGAILTAAAAMAQPATEAQKQGVPPNPRNTILHFESQLGSFRLIDGTGKTEISFAGTLLISNLEGRHTASPSLRKEFDKMDRVVYSGRGTVTVIGKWRAVQVFGQDMKGFWFGTGVARFVGEFDRNLNTGFYWFDDPKRKQYWFANSVTTVNLPSVQPGRTDVVPRRRTGGR